MQKRGALTQIVPILTLLVLLAFFFFSMSSSQFGPTGLVAGPSWIGQSSRIAIPAETATSVNLDAYFSSDSEITYVATSVAGIAAAVTGSTLTLTPAAGFTGERTIAIYASDGESVTRKRMIVTVTATSSETAATAGTETSSAASTPVASAPAAPAFKVEPEIEQQLAINGEVGAIIILQDVPFTFAAHSAPALKRSILEQRKQRVDAAQDALLAKVNDVPAGTGDALGNGITGAAVADYDFELVREYETVNALAVTLTRQGLAKLRDDPAVAQILLDRPFQALRAQSVPLVDADDVWQMTVNNTNLTGAGETICIIDTGLDLTHPAFANKTLTGYDFYNNDADPQDDAGNSHGTHVAGIAAGNDSTKGVAPDARIVPVKVCNSAGGCNGNAILAGIDYCNNNSVAYNIVAISGSLGDGGQYTSSNCPSLFDTAMATSVSLGVIPVFASGNNGYTGGVSYPACSPYALSVGSVSKSDGVESYSNRGGDRTDTFAPGTGIVSTVIGGSTGSLSGTSMATPHVSGIIALIQQNQRAQGKLPLTLAEMRQLLKETGKQVGSWTRASAYAAIAKLDVNYTVNLTDNSVTNATPPKSRVAFKETTDLGKFINCSRLRHNFVDIDAVACPQFNKSARIVLEGLAGDNATPLRDGQPCPADVCQNATFVNGTLEFDVIGFSNYSGNSSFGVTALVNGCAVINSSSSLTANAPANGTCFTINASNLFLNCSGFAITADSTGTNQSAAIAVTGQTNITVQDCAIAGTNASWGAGIALTNVTDSRILNLTVTANGTGAASHAVSFSGVLRTLLANSSISTYAASGAALALLAGSDANTIDGNNITHAGASGEAILLDNGSNNTFLHTVLTAPPSWLAALPESANNNFTNTTFANAAGSIRITGSFVPAGLTNVTQERLNVAQNRAFLNSTNLSALNRSAQITLFAIGAASPLLQSDTDDDGTFGVCAACVQDSYASGTLVFTVPSFTAYTSTEGNVNVTFAKADFPGSVNAGGLLNYTLTVTVNAGNASNVTVTEYYPSQITFINSTPQPSNGTSVFALGNFSAPRTFAINITVLVQNSTSTFAMDNDANLTFLNASGGTVALSVSESTSVVGTPLPPPPAPSGGSSSGSGGGGGSSKPKKEDAPAEQPKSLPPPAAFARDTLRTTSQPQQQSKAAAPAEEQPLEVAHASAEPVVELVDEETERANALKAQKRKKLAVYVIYSTAFAILVSMAIYWVALHHRKPPQGDLPAQ
jgi:subtilisin family serine protease